MAVSENENMYVLWLSSLITNNLVSRDANIHQDMSLKSFSATHLKRKTKITKLITYFHLIDTKAIENKDVNQCKTKVLQVENLPVSG